MSRRVGMHLAVQTSTLPRHLRIVALTTAVLALLLLIGVAVIGATGPVLTFVEVQRDGAGGVDGLSLVSSVTVSPDGNHLYATGLFNFGMAVFSRDATTGALTFVEVVRQGEDGVEGLLFPEMAIISPDGRHLYVASSAEDAVSAFHRDPATGTLTFVEIQKNGVGGVDGLFSVSQVSISPDGNHLYAGGGDSLAVFSRESTTGTLAFVEVLKDDEAGIDGIASLISTTVSPDGKHLYAVSSKDNSVAVFNRNPTTGALTFVKVYKDGVNGVDGLDDPTAVTLSPDGKYLYTANPNTVATFRRNSMTGTLTFLELLEDGLAGIEGLFGSSSIVIGPKGDYLYAAVNWGDSVAVFSRDSTTGSLTLAEIQQDGVGGVDGLEGARRVTISSDGRHLYVAGQDESAVAVFRVTSVVSADLSVTKSDSPDPVVAGSTLTYTITLTNNGPDTSTSAVLTDPLPAGSIFVSATSSQGSCTEEGGAVTCSFGSLGANSAVTSTIVVIAPSVPGTITNTSSATSTTFDPNLTNNSASQSTTVEPSPFGADLAVTKTGSPDPVPAGTILTYTVTVTNNGPVTATGVTLTDTLPLSGAATTTPTQGTCSRSGAFVTCDLGTIASFASAAVTIEVAPATPGTLINTAIATSATSDPNSANNTATTTTTVLAAANLAVTKSDSSDPIAVGTTLTYTVTVTNNGPSTATGVSLTDTLPSSVAFGSATSTQGTCSHAGGTVSCGLGTLGSSASAVVTIDVTPTVAGAITNTVSATSTVLDPNPADNSASQTTTVSPIPLEADLAVTIADSPDPVATLTILTYTVNVTNNGPATATSVILTDTLPQSDVTTTTPSQGTCSRSGATVTCDLGPMAGSTSATVIIEITPATPGTITNTASVSSAVFDPNSANDTATVTTTVADAADLSVTKTDSPDPVVVGSTLTYTIIVTNNGPFIATSVNLAETLPASVTFGSATSTQGSCSQAGGTLTCGLGTLGSSASATVTVDVTPTSGGIITNTASVTSTVFDPDLANNTASQITTVIPVAPEADLSVTKSDSPDPVAAGNTLTYTITITNNGPATSTSVVLTDTLPAGVTFSSASPGCIESGGTVTCNIGALAPNASTTATITVSVDSSTTGIFTNSASVSGAQTDPNPSNDAASATTTVSPAIPVPTMSQWTLIALAILMSAAIAWRFRRRSAPVR